ncbi:Interferon alpha/beta receptor 2 [Labeo rohita]|uniref:Interferon alpha/beta receptor 2 n=1 Tax=Labeo rohita TaxID=84645 RepID=A0ABQ8MDH5_LABRO|nr:Interferon alpha/beta receptor 2 [Labeo rohita]
MTSSIVNKSITPYEDTIIGPPIIFLSGCGDCLNISISLPSESRKELRQFYTHVFFDISWKKAGQKEANQISTSGKQYVLQNLQPGDQYCVKVRPQINSNHNTQPSAWQCEYTSKEEPKGSKKILCTFFFFSLLLLLIQWNYLTCRHLNLHVCM